MSSLEELKKNLEEYESQLKEVEGNVIRQQERIKHQEEQRDLRRQQCKDLGIDPDKLADVIAEYNREIDFLYQNIQEEMIKVLDLTKQYDS